MNTTTPPQSSFETPRSAGKHVVLLVDDQPMVAEAVRRMLATETNIVVHYCANPTEAVDVANQIRPTLILQDLVMPNLNGLSLVRRFRSNPQTKTTPIIVLTTKEDSMFRKDAAASGANDYMVKLPDRLDLIARIRAFSGDYLLAAQSGPQP